MWINWKKILLAALIIGLGSVVAYFVKRHSANKDDVKLYEVRQLFSQLQLPPDFKEIGSSFSSKAESAIEDKYFISGRKYEDVKAFFVEHLTSSGWVLVGERPMTDWFRDFGGRELKFAKGEYSVVIQYAGERANDQWDYAIALEWRKKS